MALSIKMEPGKRPEDGFIVHEKVYLSADGSRVVEKTDPDVGSLYAGAGDRIPMSEALRLGLVRPVVKESRPAETKEAEPEATKAAKPRKKGKK